MMIGIGLLFGAFAFPVYTLCVAHTNDHVQAYLNALDTAFAELANALHAGNLRQNLDGRAAQSGFQRLN